MKPFVLATSYSAVLGAVLVQLRKKQGLTQAALAERMGLAPSTWCRIESGRQSMTIDQLARAVEVLQVRASEVVQQADTAQDIIRRRSVHVALTCLSNDAAIKQGFILIKRPALAALVQKVLI